jgi:AcrR family transcriptional regulator
MGTQERRARHKSALRAQILDAARELFSTEGVDKVSMRRIAERIEYSPKTLYLYFKDKREILYHLCEESFRKLDQQTMVLEQSEDDPEDLIRRGLRLYVEFGLANPHDYRIAFLSDTRDYPYRTHEELPPDSVSLSMHRRFGALLRKGVERGLFREMDPILTTHVLWAGVHGLTVALIFDPEFHWVDKARFIDETIEALIRSLKK